MYVKFHSDCSERLHQIVRTLEYETIVGCSHSLNIVQLREQVFYFKTIENTITSTTETKTISPIGR